MFKRINIIILFILFLLLPSLCFITDNIEKAFQENNPKEIQALLSKETRISLSFPSPISFSGTISSQQVYLLFKDIFTEFSTTDFKTEENSLARFPNQTLIYKTYWSFQNRTTSENYSFIMFFSLKKEENKWKIIEIKAKEF
ncbi:MAG: DUF4783 domain-containing protein [Candidatus Aminicenantia bacterium]